MRFYALLNLSVGFFGAVQSNWDEATGYLHGYKPSNSWLSKNKPARCSGMIQVAECAHNTRLSYPDVQLMAVFTVNHADDRYHGCPYGTCCAFTQLPLVTDMVPDPENSHSFFRYNLAGFPGVGTNPIADPQTGQYGYESSPDGVFHRGPTDTSTRQPQHDKNYPGFHLPKPWPRPLPFPDQPNVHPSCSKEGQPNTDPGQNGGKSEGGYHDTGNDHKQGKHKTGGKSDNGNAEGHAGSRTKPKKGKKGNDKVDYQSGKGYYADHAGKESESDDQGNNSSNSSGSAENELTQTTANDDPENFTSTK